jgi:hypothetical protein
VEAGTEARQIYYAMAVVTRQRFSNYLVFAASVKEASLSVRCLSLSLSLSLYHPHPPSPPLDQINASPILLINFTESFANFSSISATNYSRHSISPTLLSDSPDNIRNDQSIRNVCSNSIYPTSQYKSIRCSVCIFFLL